MRNKKTGQALKRAGPKPQCSSHMITWGKHENTGEAEIAIFFKLSKIKLSGKYTETYSALCLRFLRFFSW
jgi:hypothetical protein